MFKKVQLLITRLKLFTFSKLPLPSSPPDQIGPMGDSHALLFKRYIEHDTTNKRESLWHYAVPRGAITSHESDLLPDRTITSQQYFITIPFDYTAQKCGILLPFSTLYWRAFYIRRWWNYVGY